MSNPKMPDLNALMKQAQKLQGDVARIQEELAKMTCEGAAGGGLVTATVNGQFEVVRVKIDKTVVDPNDVGMRSTRRRRRSARRRRRRWRR
jgi:DNA-binding YbaB/EbfC family protein